MSKVLDIQTILTLREKEVETLKQEMKNIIIMHHEELDILHKEIDDLKLEKELLEKDIKEYNTVNPNDMTNIYNYEKWLNGKGGETLANAYSSASYSDYENDETEYEPLQLVK